MGTHHDWTEERLEKFRRLYDEGLSHSKIAAEMGGITRNASIGKAARLGLPSRLGVRSPKPWLQESISERQWYRRRRQKVPGEFKNGAAVRQRQPDKTNVEPSVPVCDPISLVDLEDHHCRYPLGEPSATMLYCGAPQCGKEFSPYCAEHHTLTHATRPGHPFVLRRVV